LSPTSPVRSPKAEKEEQSGIVATPAAPAMESGKREREVSHTQTIGCAKTQHRPPPGCYDRDSGSGRRRGGAEELWWTIASDKAINQKRGGRRTHFGGFRP
jgi:hypothetical protein